MHLDLCTLLCVEIGLGIVGREKNIEAELYDAFYGGQWMKNYPFSNQIHVFIFWYTV